MLVRAALGNTQELEGVPPGKAVMLEEVPDWGVAMYPVWAAYINPYLMICVSQGQSG